MTTHLIAGVDEAGRGPLAGPVIAAAVILNPDCPLDGVKDSKTLTEKKREVLFETITSSCLAYSIGRADVEEIDEINILQATLLAMRRAILTLSITPAMVLVDGNQLPEIALPAKAVIQGDKTVEAISAASILAKVVRDREMSLLDKAYPGYGLAQHKGYGTKAHMQALAEKGATKVHRKTFAPVKKVMQINRV